MRRCVGHHESIPRSLAADRSFPGAWRMPPGVPTLAGRTTPGSPRPRDHSMSIALGLRRFADVRCLLVTVVCAAAVTGTARGGGGPENVFLVVNSASVDSIGVANAFVASRGIPPINILMLPWQDNVESTTIARFRNELPRPSSRRSSRGGWRHRSTASPGRAIFPGGSISRTNSRPISPRRTVIRRAR